MCSYFLTEAQLKKFSKEDYVKATGLSEDDVNDIFDMTFTGWTEDILHALCNFCKVDYYKDLMQGVRYHINCHYAEAALTQIAGLILSPVGEMCVAQFAGFLFQMAQGFVELGQQFDDAGNMADVSFSVQDVLWRSLQKMTLLYNMLPSEQAETLDDQIKRSVRTVKGSKPDLK